MYEDLDEHLDENLYEHHCPSHGLPRLPWAIKKCYTLTHRLILSIAN